MAVFCGIIIKKLVSKRDTGVPHSRLLAGEQNARTLCTCNTYNIPLRGDAGVCSEFCILLYKEGLMEQDDFDNPEELSELDKLRLEHKLLELAYENSYSILTNKISFDKLLSFFLIIGFLL